MVKKIVPKIWEGVLIGDEELEEKRTEIEPQKDQEPPVYGGAVITVEQKSVLKLPPGLRTYEQLQERKMKVDVEMMMAKMRMEVKGKEQREGQE